MHVSPWISKLNMLSLILNQPASSEKLLRIWKLATEKRPEQPLVRLSIQGTMIIYHTYFCWSSSLVWLLIQGIIDDWSDDQFKAPSWSYHSYFWWFIWWISSWWSKPPGNWREWRELLKKASLPEQKWRWRQFWQFW